MDEKIQPFLIMIDYISPKTQQQLSANGKALTTANGETFPVVNNIPRFVDSDNYAQAFGYQWNIHVNTQLDSYTGHPISKDRLERCLGYSVDQLKGKNVLEAGSGAGRFTEHLVKSGALVHSFDLSNAVEANAKNIGDASNYRIAQASIYDIPYPDEQFDVVICLGVLQHTPDPDKSIECLYRKVKPGGQLVIDHYSYSLARFTKASTLIRYILKEMPKEKSKKITNNLVNFFFPLHWACRKFYPAQAVLSRISPCLFYYKDFPFLTKEQHFDLTQLDTYDHLTDYYKHLRTQGQLRSLLEKLGAVSIETFRGGIGVEARCLKPSKTN
jgi:2-polyprenyl-3-methyl-5-hydroxy-6-metoxy-1,4-benzoquinol methylase